MFDQFVELSFVLRLPWTRGKVKPSQIHFYVKDVLQTKNALVGHKQSFNNQRNLNDENLEISGETELITENHDPKSCNSSPDSEKKDMKISEQMRLEAPIALIRNLESKKPEIAPEHFGQVEVSESTDLSESDIRDEDLGEYIRSKEEVTVLKRISKKLEQDT